MNNLVQKTMDQEERNQIAALSGYTPDEVAASSVTSANPVVDNSYLDALVRDVLGPGTTVRDETTAGGGNQVVGGGPGGGSDGGQDEVVASPVTPVTPATPVTPVTPATPGSDKGIGVYRPRERAGLPYTAEVASRRTPVFGQAPLPPPVQPQPVVPSTNPFAPPPLFYSPPSFMGIASLPDMYRRRMAYPFPIS